MGWNKKHKLLLTILLLFVGSWAAYAYEDAVYTDDEIGSEYYYEDEMFPDDNAIEQERYNAPLNQRQQNKSAWEKAREGLNYKGGPNQEIKKGKNQEAEADSSKRSKSQEPELSPEPFSFQLSPIIGQLLLYAGIAVLIIAALFLIYYIVRHVSSLSPNTKVTQQLRPSEQLQNLERELHKSDLEKALDAALAEQDYHTAVRIYYLMVIKELSNKSWIKWKQDKTNGEYLREMSVRDEYYPFQELTTRFEKVWYGDVMIDEEGFNTLRPGFDLFIQQIKRSK